MPVIFFRSSGQILGALAGRARRRTQLYVDVVEEAIMNRDGLPGEMRGWRRLRIEYGRHAEACLLEAVVYLPPDADVEQLERLLNGSAGLRARSSIGPRGRTRRSS